MTLALVLEASGRLPWSPGAWDLSQEGTLEVAAALLLPFFLLLPRSSSSSVQILSW